MASLSKKIQILQTLRLIIWTH